MSDKQPWQWSEKRTAQLTETNLTAGSGSRPGLKGDARDGQRLIENKYTVRRDYFTLTRAMLRKADRQSLAANGRDPYVAFEIRGEGTWILEKQYDWRPTLGRAIQFKAGVKTLRLRPDLLWKLTGNGNQDAELFVQDALGKEEKWTLKALTKPLPHRTMQ